jgi:hypothetical protein
VIRRSRESGNQKKSRHWKIKAVDSRLSGNDEFFELPSFQTALEQKFTEAVL